MRSLIPQAAPPAGAKKISTIALFGAFGPPILTAVRSFSDAGIAVVVLSVAHSVEGSAPPLWSNAIRHAACISPDVVGTPAGIAIVSDFLRQTHAQAVLAFWDPQMLWLAANQDALPQTCKLLASPQEALQAVQSKQDQLQIAQRNGFQLLPTWELFTHEDDRAIAATAFPICLRPAVPQGVHPAFKAEVLPHPAALKSFLQSRTWGPEPLLAQPFLPHPSVVVHGVRSESGAILALEAFVAPMKFEGVALELRPFPLDENTARCCRSFVEEMGITGPFHFDLLSCPKTGSVHYLEINVRLGGTTDKVFRLGFNEPLLALSAYGFDVPVSTYRPSEGRSVVNRKFVVKHLYSVLRGRLSALDYPVAGRWRHILLSLRSLLWAKDSIASLRDLPGTWFFYVSARRHARVARSAAPNPQLAKN